MNKNEKIAIDITIEELELLVHCFHVSHIFGGQLSDCFILYNVLAEELGSDIYFKLVKSK